MPRHGDLIERLYGLRTHPFAPELGLDHQPIDPSVLTTTLDPYADERVLGYFFDVYEWHNEAEFSKLDRAAGLRTFVPQSGNDPLLIVLSGPANSGRRSLARLTRRRIRDSHVGDPIPVEVELNGLNANIHARDLAQAFVDCYVYASGEVLPSEQKLREIFDSALAQEQAAPGTGFKTIFQRLARITRPHCTSRPILFEITGVESMGLWLQLHSILRHLANYIVFITGDDDEAHIARQTMPRKGVRLASVTATALDVSKAIDYVRFRCSAERNPNAKPDQRFPFDDDAIRAIFNSGSRTPKHVVQWPVKWIIQNLRSALDRHLESLSGLISQNADAATFASSVVIDATTLKKYIEKEQEKLSKGQVER